MIGQTKLLQRIDKMIASSFPRFVIICGPVNSGKQTVAKYIAKGLQAQLVFVGVKVEEVREVISLAYRQSEPTVYLIANADRMSPAAKNALLKVTEEPPRQAYFILTLQDMANTLETIKSRAQVLPLDNYSQDEIAEYCNKYTLTTEEFELVASVCSSPGDVDTLVSYRPLEFFGFVETVADNVGKVNGSNAFKIGKRLKYKDEDEGYDVALFMCILIFVYLAKLKQSAETLYIDKIKVVSKYLQQLSISGVNKSATVDMMILELRGLE